MSDNPRELREALERAEAELKKRDAEMARVQEQMQSLAHSNRQMTANSLFTQLGYPASHAELFLKTHQGEISADAVEGFVKQYNLVPAPAQAAPQPAAPNFMAGAGHAVPSSGRQPTVVTSREMENMLTRDPAGTQAAIASGQLITRQWNGNEVFSQNTFDNYVNGVSPFHGEEKM